jgi:hypothetical protein
MRRLPYPASLHLDNDSLSLRLLRAQHLPQVTQQESGRDGTVISFNLDSSISTASLPLQCR